MASAPSAGPERPRALIALTAAAGLAAGVLGAPAASAAVRSDAPVVINEVYGGGGNSGSTYTHDFVELVNVTDEPVDLAGWSLQYASSTGRWSAANTFALTGSIAPGGSFLVQQAQGSGGTTPLPAPGCGGLARALRHRRKDRPRLLDRPGDRSRRHRCRR